ncbi:MAG: SDR family NAD(P)-dependent oxidoreductase, partial [Gammaproteobacteria bacterium]
MHVLITGHSRGLGAALCHRHLAAGDQVWGMSRGATARPAPGLHERRGDLARLDQVTSSLDALVPRDVALDRVYLNAGVLGRIANLRDTPLADIAAVMDINVWANKLVLDWLAARARPAADVVLVSSGAGVTGNHGWGAYALSKAALNMLAQLYAHEMPDTHLLALAPGLVDTE